MVITLQSFLTNVTPWPGYTVDEQKKHFSKRIFLYINNIYLVKSCEFKKFIHLFSIFFDFEIRDANNINIRICFVDLYECRKKKVRRFFNESTYI